jgi:hypothetical protein
MPRDVLQHKRQSCAFSVHRRWRFSSNPSCRISISATLGICILCLIAYLKPDTGLLADAGNEGMAD